MGTVYLGDYMDWEELRGFRDERLTLLDRYQLIIRWELLTEVQKTDLKNYRTTLLDLPQNYDTPDEAFLNIPSKPLWMT